MAACPNCHTELLDGQLFCRVCGFCLDTGFQISTHSLGLPALPTAKSSATKDTPSQHYRQWQQRFALPLMGFLIALFIGGLSATSTSNLPPFSSIYLSSRKTINIERSYIGIYPRTTQGCSNSAFVEDIVVSGPAAQAGIAAGDEIVAINNQPVFSAQTLISVLKQTPPGTKVMIQIMRGEQSLTLPITTVRRAQLDLEMLDKQSFLGVGELSSYNLYMNENFFPSRGVQIGKVVLQSAAEMAGLQRGDIILEIDHQPTRTPFELRRRILAIAPGETASISIMRDGEVKEVTARMGQQE